MSDTVQDYVVNFKVEKALRAIKKLKAASKDLTRDATKNTVAQQKAEAEYLKAVAKLEDVKQKTARETTKTIDRELKTRERAEKRAAREAAKASRDKAKAEEKAQKEQTRAAQKAAREFEKMEDAKTRYFRSAVFSRLSPHEKMLQQQRLNEQENYNDLINMQRRYQAESARLSRQARARERAERERQQEENQSAIVGMGKGAAIAAGAAVAGQTGFTALDTGINTAKMLEEASNRLGVSVEVLQQEIAANKATANLTADQSISIMQDNNDRMGEAIKEMEFNSKTGKFEKTEAAPLANELLKAGLVTKENYKEILKDVVNLPKLTALAFKKNNTSIQEQTFITEAFSSDFVKILTSHMNKSEQRKQIAETIANSSGTFTKEDIENITEFNHQLNLLSSQMQLSNSFTKEFIKALGDDGIKNLGTLSNDLSEFVGVLGKLSGLAVKLAIEGRDLLKFFFKPVFMAVDLLKNVFNELKPVLDALPDTLTTMKNKVQYAFSSMVNNIVDLLNKIPFINISKPFNDTASNTVVSKVDPKSEIPDFKPVAQLNTQKLDSMPTFDLGGLPPMPAIDQTVLKNQHTKPDITHLYQNHVNRNKVINPMGAPASSAVGSNTQPLKEVVTQTPIELKLDGQTLSTVVVESSTFRQGVKLVNSETN